jgi:hypothetical protein
MRLLGLTLALYALAALLLYGLPAAPASAHEPVSIPAPGETRRASPAPEAGPQPVGVAQERPEPGPDEPAGGGWVEDRIKGAITGLIKSVNKQFLEVLPVNYLGDQNATNVDNFITRTPPKSSYANEAVLGFLRIAQLIANGALTLVLVVGGLNMMFGSAFSGEQYATLSRLLPRVVLGYVLVNTSVFWVQLLVDVNNALCEAFDPRNALRQILEKDAEQGTLVFALIFLALLIVFAFAILRMIVRLAVLDLLIVLSPLALLCWVLPQTQGYARAWMQKFTQTLFGQLLFVVALGLAVQMRAVVNMQGTTEAFQLLLWVAMLAVSLQAPSFFRAAEHHSGVLGLAAVQGLRSFQARARGARGDRAIAAYRKQVLAQGERQHQERMGQTERHNVQRLALTSSLSSAHQEFNEARRKRSTAEAERRFQESRMLRGSARGNSPARGQAAPDGAPADPPTSSPGVSERPAAPTQQDTMPIVRGSIEGLPPAPQPAPASPVRPRASSGQPEIHPVAQPAAQKGRELRAKQVEFLGRAAEADRRASAVRELLGDAAENHPAYKKHTAVARTYRATAAEYETGAMLAETQYRMVTGRELRPETRGEGEPKGPATAPLIGGKYNFGGSEEPGDA